jgi:anti-anti-sigma regulatory factor
MAGGVAKWMAQKATNVSFFCAAGLTALLRANDIITNAGGRLLLRSPSPQTQRILAITATNHILQLGTSDATSYHQ